MAYGVKMSNVFSMKANICHAIMKANNETNMAKTIMRETVNGVADVNLWRLLRNGECGVSSS